jgi:hypothetical protein
MIYDADFARGIITKHKMVLQIIPQKERREENITYFFFSTTKENWLIIITVPSYVYTEDVLYDDQDSTFI